MTKDQFEEKTEEFESKLGIYTENIQMINGLIESKCFRTAAILIKESEALFSDGLLEELNYFADEFHKIDPPESEMDIIRDSDGFRVGE